MNGNRVTIRIISADPMKAIEAAAIDNIQINQVKILNPLTLQFDINEKDVPRIKKINCCCGDELEIINDRTKSTVCHRLLSRSIMLIGIVVWMLLLLYLPGRVLFVRVEGNITVPEQLILENAEQYGVVFGAKRRDLRSEKIKNGILSGIPELHWVGVNTKGCMALISVNERTIPENVSESCGIGNVVAARDGVVSSVTVTKGTPLCRPGQAVTQGQILVSGYTDCGLVVRAETPVAEVFGITERCVSINTMRECIKREEITKIKTDYSIQIGKNVVKLLGSGRIPNGTCVKICSKKYLSLPGGFYLPIALICEQTIQYRTVSTIVAMGQEKIKILADSFMQVQMPMGRVLSSYYQVLEEGDNLVRGKYICEEMIGVLREEGEIKIHGK